LYKIDIEVESNVINLRFYLSSILSKGEEDARIIIFLSHVPFPFGEGRDGVLGMDNLKLMTLG
jgi:hypothetical protein